MPTEFLQLKKAAKRANVIPVVREISADLLTPVSAFIRLNPGAARGARTDQVAGFLFESVEGGERLARYSFLNGTAPREKLFIKDGALVMESGRLRKKIPGNPVSSLGERLARYKSAKIPGLPPFSGGAVGYSGYDCVRFLERLPVRNVSSQSYDACFMVFGNVVVFDHVKRKILLISNIFTSDESLKTGYARALADIAGMELALSRPSSGEMNSISAPKPAGKAPEYKAVQGRAGFIRSVRKIKEHIYSGDIFQCVLSEQFKTRVRVPPFQIYRSLRCVSPAPYLYYLATGDEVLLGASPEMLVRCVDGRVETCPIAGTRPRGKTPAEDRRREKSLLADAKEKAEHLMLVDLGRNDLGRVSKPGSVRVKEFMQVQRFSHVMHLVSLVQGELKSGVSAWDALSACFPAGTLTGAPKIKAMEIISELEPFRRGPYGGAVVYHDFSGNIDSCITIRSLFIKKDRAILQAGAGIVADSNPSSEYDEVLNKTRSVRHAIAAAHGAL